MIILQWKGMGFLCHLFGVTTGWIHDRCKCTTRIEAYLIVSLVLMTTMRTKNKPRAEETGKGSRCTANYTSCLWHTLEKPVHGSTHFFCHLANLQQGQKKHVLSANTFCLISLQLRGRKKKRGTCPTINFAYCKEILQWKTPKRDVCKWCWNIQNKK